MTKYSHVAAWIDLDAVSANLKAIKGNTKPGTKICAVIKADGYGHGAVPVAKRVEKAVDFFAVSAIEEAVNLRDHQIEKPILILGYIPEEKYETAVRNGFRVTVYHYEMAKKFSQAAVQWGKPAYIHVKLETGMNRLGFQESEETLRQIEDLSRLPGIVLEGIFSHFARADEADKSYARKQYEIFTGMTEKLSKRGIEIPVKHMGNSAVIVDLPEYDLDMVRAGIVLYGLYPSEEVRKENVELTPALRLTSVVSFVKTIKAGEAVGYGGTYVAEKEMKIATIPVGYGDGYPRNLSNKGYVLIRGRKAMIVGKVCMDQMMVDVTEVSGIREGDPVTLVGKDGEEKISVEELANLAGSFNYEFICGLGKRIPRIYVSKGEVVGAKDYFNDHYEIRLS